jgi:hypothetical protein
MSAMAALAGTMGLPLPSTASTVSFATIPKSLWVWKTSLMDINKVADFSTRYGFNTIFYSVPPADRGSLPALQSALLLLKERGISAYIVGGAPTWALDQNLPSSFQSLLNLAGQGANGICLDVEPQDSDTWKTSQDHQAIGMDYLNFLQNAVALAKSNGLPTWVSTVPAFNNISISHNGANMLGAVTSIIQAQVLMAYRSNPSEALRVAARSLETIAAVNGKFWFGVTTKIGASSTISYAGSTDSNFRQAMIVMDTALQNEPGYLGIAINDYQSLRTLLGV